MIKRSFRFPAALLAVVCALAFTAANVTAAEKFKIDPVHSSIGFKVRHFFGKVSGRFDKFSGEISVDAGHPENSSVNCEIQAESIDTANDKRDTHLRSPEFFDAKTKPLLSFKSKSVKKTGEDAADVVGDLTMHGVTKEVTLQVKFLGKGKGPGPAGDIRSGWEAKTSVKRSEFGLSWNQVVEGVSAVGDDVDIDIAIEAVEEKPAS